MSQRERAFIYASIDLRVAEEKRLASQADDVDPARAEAALQRAVERLHVAQLR